MSEIPSASQDSSAGKKKAPGPEDVKSAFKKRGQFDALRKEFFQRLLSDPAHTQLQESIRTLAMAELSQDKALRARDRGKAASLLEGVMERGEIYEDVTKYFDASLEAERKRIEKMVRDVYKDLGGELSDEEEETQEEDKTEDRKEETRKDETMKEEEVLKEEDEATAAAAKASEDETSSIEKNVRVVTEPIKEENGGEEATKETTEPPKSPQDTRMEDSSMDTGTKERTEAPLEGSDAGPQPMGIDMPVPNTPRGT